MNGPKGHSLGNIDDPNSGLGGEYQWPLTEQEQMEAVKNIHNAKNDIFKRFLLLRKKERFCEDRNADTGDEDYRVLMPICSIFLPKHHHVSPYWLKVTQESIERFMITRGHVDEQG